MSSAPYTAPVPRRRPRIDPIDVVLGMLTGVLFIYLYLPLLVVIVLSFNSSELAAFPLRGLTLRWFAQAFNNAQVTEGLWNSIVVGLAVVAITLPLALMFAHVMTRQARGKMAGILTGLISVPMQTPRIILAVLLLLLFSLIGVRTNLITVVLSHVVLTLPFATLIIAARLRSIDRVLEEAASDLGAFRWQTWAYILLPLLAPAVTAAGLITFTISFDEMVVSYFTIGTQSTLPIVIWGMLSQGYTQELNAVGALITASTLVIIAIAQALRGRGRPT
jgi:spermidine/putrescine transport system permease protein